MILTEELKFKVLCHLKFIVALITAIELYLIGKPDLLWGGLLVIIVIMGVFIFRDLKKLSI